MTSNPQKQKTFFSSKFPFGTALSRVRPFVGVGLLIAIVIFLVERESLPLNIDNPLFALSVAILIAVNFLHARVLIIIATSFKSRLSHKDAFHLSALGTLGNSLGGLPLGVTLKYAVLYKRCGLKILQITGGFAISTIIITIALFFFAMVSVWFTALPLATKLTPTTLLLLAISISALLHFILRNRPFYRDNIGVFLRPSIFSQTLLTNCAIASLLVLNGWLLGSLLYPEIENSKLIFTTAMGLAGGLASLMQSVGGIHEIAMGVTAHYSGLVLVDGLKLGLAMRMSSIIAATISVGFLYLFLRKKSSPTK